MFLSTEETVDITFYYKKHNKIRYVIFEKEEFDKIELTEEEKKKYTELNVEYRCMTWGVQNALHAESMVEGDSLYKEFNQKLYNENKLLKVIRDWDAKNEEGKKVPITMDTIRSLSPDVGYALLNTYDRLYNNEDIEKK